MDPIDLGERIQTARLAAGMTQQQLCEAGHLSYSTLAKIERGAIRAPSIFTVGQIAKTLNLSVEELLNARPATEVKQASVPDSPKSRLQSTPIKFVYCDINGVLVRFYQRAFTALAHDTNQTLDLVEQVFWRYNDAVCTGEMGETELNKILAESLEVDSVDWQRYYISAVEPIPESQTYLAELVKTQKVGLLSNIFPGYLEALIAAGKVPDLPYAALVDSSLVHQIKPHPEIYRVAEEKAGVKGSEILFIDDTRANIVAAQQQGWRCIWFDSYHPQESINDIQSVLA